MAIKMPWYWKPMIKPEPIKRRKKVQSKAAKKALLIYLFAMGALFVSTNVHAGTWYTGGGGGVLFNDDDVQGEGRTLKGFGAIPYYGLRAGYESDMFLRVEFNFAHHLNYEMRIQEDAPEDGSRYVLHHTRSGVAYSGWLWGYADLPQLEWDRIRPFVGAGTGLAYLKTYPYDGFRLAYGLTGGLAFDLTDNVTIDIAYRYMDFTPFGGRIEHSHHGVYAGFRVGLE